MLVRNNISKYIVFIVAVILAILLSGLSGILGFVGLGLILSIWYRYLVKDPVLAFLFSFSIVLNMGYYFIHASFGLPRFFQYPYLFFILCFLVMFSPQLTTERQSGLDLHMKRLILVLLIFIGYQLFISILIKLEQDIYGTVLIVFRNLLQIVGVLILIPSYYLAKKNPTRFIDTIVLVAFILYGVFFITYFTGIPLMKIYFFERFEGYSLTRVYFQNSGYASYVFSLSILCILLGVRYKFKKILYISSILMIGSVLITLSRLMILTMIGTVIVLLFLLRTYIGISFKKKITFFSSISFVLLILSLFFPGILYHVFETFKLSFYEMIGTLPEGTTQGRTSYELVNVLPVIKENLFFGTGFQDFWNDEANYGDFGISDVPFLANLGIYGLFGMLIYFLSQFMIIGRIFKFIMILKKDPGWFRKHYLLELILLLTLATNQIVSLFFRTVYISYELVLGELRIFSGFQIGMIYGLCNYLEKSFSYFSMKDLK
jgi:hypothetical protein